LKEDKSLKLANNEEAPTYKAPKRARCIPFKRREKAYHFSKRNVKNGGS